MKNLLILFFLYSCSGGGPDSSTESIVPSAESKIKNDYVKIRDITPNDFFKIINFIPTIKERGSFNSTSSLEFKQGAVTCVGKTELKVTYDGELKRSSVSRKVTKTSGSCPGSGKRSNYQTEMDLNFKFLYKMAQLPNVKISEGTLDGRTTYMISSEEKEQTNVYLLSVNGEAMDSLQSEYTYLGNDGYIKIRTKILPAESSKIDGNLIKETPETGDILELSEFPLYDLIS